MPQDYENMICVGGMADGQIAMVAAHADCWKIADFRQSARETIFDGDIHAKVPVEMYTVRTAARKRNWGYVEKIKYLALESWTDDEALPYFMNYCGWRE